MQVNDGNFDATVLRSQIPVLVDFWASWCAPCKMMEPLVDRLAAEWEGRLAVHKLNVDRNPHTAEAFRIQNLPTFILFDQGREVGRRTGAQTENQLRAMAADRLEAPPVTDNREVVVVTGLPRSGTSMMMRMLEAGGVPPQVVLA